MPDVRLAATGMDSCPASDEDTDDELESARRSSDAARTRLLPSTSRQLVRNTKRNIIGYFYIFMSVLVTSRSTVLFSIKVNCILNIVLLIACVFLCVNRQVGQSNRPTFRPGLEGGSSEDEASSGRGGASSSGIGHRRSAEGQVINPPVTGITPIFNVCCVCL